MLMTITIQEPVEETAVETEERINDEYLEVHCSKNAV